LRAISIHCQQPDHVMGITTERAGKVEDVLLDYNKGRKIIVSK
jgi:sporulation protein YlmC with PRC-barrel domain